MTPQVLFRSPATASQKNRPLLEETPKKGNGEGGGGCGGGKGEKKATKRMAEVAGGTAADCAAVCCCCPCSVMNLVLLAVYKVPASLCKKAIKRQRFQRKLTQKQSLLRSSSNGCREDLEREVREIVEKEKDNNVVNDEETEAIVLEREMWAQFYATGFWRSPSQRNT